MAFLVEINCIGLILAKLAQHNSFALAPENLAVISRLGLHTAKPHRKFLLCFYGDTVYEVNIEDSEALNEIWDCPRSRMPQEDTVDSEGDEGDSIGRDGSGYHGGSDFKYDGLEDEKRLKKSHELLKGNEVHDISEWLSDRGYKLPEDKDFVENPEGASIHEMAASYQKLNERFGLR
jgi:hypothetical protein